jgi:hypothetical protein
MNFYTKQHAFYCGVDLHARTLYLCILSRAGDKLLHCEVPAEPAPDTFSSSGTFSSFSSSLFILAVTPFHPRRGSPAYDLRRRARAGSAVLPL